MWNARGIKNKINEIQVKSEAYDIMIIVETKLKEFDKIKIHGFEIYRKDGVRSKKKIIIILTAIENNMELRGF